jgi:hypothetical protein
MLKKRVCIADSSMFEYVIVLNIETSSHVSDKIVRSDALPMWMQESIAVLDFVAPDMRIPRVGYRALIRQADGSDADMYVLRRPTEENTTC